MIPHFPPGSTYDDTDTATATAQNRAHEPIPRTSVTGAFNQETNADSILLTTLIDKIGDLQVDLSDTGTSKRTAGHAFMLALKTDDYDKC